jgi:hypothetical protein
MHPAEASSLPICPRTQCTHKKCPSIPLLGSHHVHLTFHGCVHRTKVEESSRSSRTSTSDTPRAEHFRKSRHFGSPARNQRHLPPGFQVTLSSMVAYRHLHASSLSERRCCGQCTRLGVPECILPPSHHCPVRHQNSKSCRLEHITR